MRLRIATEAIVALGIFVVYLQFSLSSKVEIAGDGGTALKRVGTVVATCQVMLHAVLATRPFVMLRGKGGEGGKAGMQREENTKNVIFRNLFLHACPLAHCLSWWRVWRVFSRDGVGWQTADLSLLLLSLVWVVFCFSLLPEKTVRMSCVVSERGLSVCGTHTWNVSQEMRPPPPLCLLMEPSKLLWFEILLFDDGAAVDASIRQVFVNSEQVCSLMLAWYIYFFLHTRALSCVFPSKSPPRGE